MLRNVLKAGVVIICAFLLHNAAFAADVVELPQEELATESVLPVFDRSVSVKNRNIVTAKRWDADLFYSYAMTEPIANVSKLGVAVYYNISEEHALGFLYAKNFSGLSSYANQLDSQYNLDFSRAPQPLATYMLDYNIKAFYGKMSLTKSLVLNTLLYGSASAGMIQYEHKTYPAIALGLGQKFFFSRNWALRVDLRFYANQAPIPFLGNNQLKPTTQPPPTFDQFQERVTYTTNLDFGLSYLF